MPDPTDTPPNSKSPPAPGGDPNASRRRLLQGGLAAAPVLMTLVSRPVLAQTTCTTPSGFVSANASTAGRGVACTGHKPDYWKSTTAWTNSWPSPSYKPTTLFNSVFAHNATCYPGKTLRDVLNLGAGSPNDVARYIVAALLNVAAGWTPVLTITVVKDMWSEYLPSRTFSPSSGARWSEAELMDYLRITTPL